MPQVLKVLIKGLNKVVEFPADTPMEVIERSIKGGWGDIESIAGLPMDTASRMDRARYLGFDPDDVIYSGGAEQVTDIRSGGLYDGIFGSRDEGIAESFGDEVTEFLIPESKILSQAELSYRADPDVVEKSLRDSLYDDVTPEEYDEIYEAVIEDRGLHSADIDEDRLLDIFGESDVGRADWEGQKFRGKIANDLGFDAVEMADETGTSILMTADGKSIRRAGAEFNPAGRGLLGGIAGGAVGLGALGQSGESEANGLGISRGNAASQSASRLLQEGLIDQQSRAYNIPYPSLNKLGLFLQRGPQSFLAEGTGRALETLSLGRQNELSDEEIRSRAIGLGLDFL